MCYKSIITNLFRPHKAAKIAQNTSLQLAKIAVLLTLLKGENNPLGLFHGSVRTINGRGLGLGISKTVDFY